MVIGNFYINLYVEKNKWNEHALAPPFQKWHQVSSYDTKSMKVKLPPINPYEFIIREESNANRFDIEDSN
jgi:hypothetical protein